MTNINFTDLSKKITKDLTKKEKQDYGIYFTPKSIIYNNLDILEDYLDNIKTILEPSCGTCEYINILEEKYENIKITGIEYNDIIYDNIKNIKFKNTIIIKNNYLEYKTNEKYDLIIGNPPYFVINKKGLHKDYLKYIEGRPNIFSLFIIKSLNLLNDGGILSFILPKNFINCLYYDKLRRYINENYKIINIKDCNNDKYLETQQDTIIFIIQNIKQTTDNNKYVLNINKYCIFNTCENILKLNDLYKESKTLKDLEFKVNVGNIVWNQHKLILSDDENMTRLIYSSDITNDNKLIKNNYKNNEKKNYINKEGINDIVLVINRGYGIGEYKFNYCLIDVNYNYLIENHLIIIKYLKDISKAELLELYNKIILSLSNEKTKEFIKIYFGNNAINTTELNYILPIYNL